MPMSAQDNPWSRTSHTRSRSPASIFVADVDGTRSSSSSPHIKAHFGSDGGSAGTAWPTCRRCRCLPGDERGNPTWGRTPTSRTTASDAAPQSATPAPSNHRTQTAYAGTLPGHSAGRPCATAMSGMLAPWFTEPARWRPSLAALPWPSGPRPSVWPGSERLSARVVDNVRGHALALKEWTLQ